MPKVKLAAISLESIPAAKSTNLAKIEQWSQKASAEGVRLACFPAMAVTGYWQTNKVGPYAEILKADLDNPALVYPVGPSVNTLTELARQGRIHLAAGIVEDLDFYHLRNSVGVFGPAGHLGTAAEMHTSVARHAAFAGGRNCPVFDLGDVKVGVLVGDDVFYPEVARMLVLQGARLLIASMATPASEGMVPWREQMAKLLAVRAIENGVGILAVDAAGSIRNPQENANYQFSGQAMAFEADGRLVAQTPADNHEKMLIAELNIPAEASERLSRRRPFLYQPLAAEAKLKEVPGTRPQDWDAQGELVWSRLRDLGFFGADLYRDGEIDFRRQNQALMVTVSSLPALRNYEVVVLTRPSLSQLGASAAAKLTDWVAKGGTLVLDGYCGRNAETFGPLTGINGSLRPEIHIPSYEDASRVTVKIRPSAKDAVFNGMDTQHGAKVWGQIWLPEENAKISARPLAEFYSPAGQKLGPGLYHHAFGKGQVYTFTYSLGYSQLLLMQGRGTTRDLGSFPERVAANVPRDGDVSMWGDQIVTDADDQFFPSADYHLIPLLNILRAAVSDHVLVSPVPDGKEFGVIFTGDSDRASADQVNEYADLLAPYGIRPTQFILTGGYNPRELNPDCEYGIHPLHYETDRDCFDTLVSYGFDPKQLVSGRRHCLIQFGLTETLERMAELGIRFTSNNWDFPYSETQSTAFLYGSTLPHQIYNWEGRRIGIVDIPQVFMDYRPFRICTEAAYRDLKRTHGVGAWNFHPQNLVMPDLKETIDWLARQVREDDAWCGTMGEYGDWYLQRDRVTISCEDSTVSTHGESPAGLTLLSPNQELTINGQVSHAERSSMWYGQKYWVHEQVIHKKIKGKKVEGVSL